MSVILINKIVDDIVKQQKFDLYCYIDIGIKNLGLVIFAFPKDLSTIAATIWEKFEIKKYNSITSHHVLSCYPAIWAQRIDITNLSHTIVEYNNCKLKHFHTKEIVDRCLHLFQEYNIFRNSKRIGIERQQVDGHTDITNLIKREFPEKTFYIHPCAVQNYMDVFHKSYDERKVNFVVNSVPYIPLEICPELHQVVQEISILDKPGYFKNLPESPRVHDIADACILAKYDLDKNLLPHWRIEWSNYFLIVKPMKKIEADSIKACGFSKRKVPESLASDYFNIDDEYECLTTSNKRKFLSQSKMLTPIEPNVEWIQNDGKTLHHDKEIEDNIYNKGIKQLNVVLDQFEYKGHHQKVFKYGS